MFFIRAAFWLTLVILILPAEQPNDGMRQSAAATQRINGGELFDAARMTVDDVSAICARQPGVCDASAAAWDMFVRKAQFGAKLVYRAVTGNEPASAPAPQNVPVKGDKEAARVPAREANSQNAGSPAEPAVQNTLTETDKQPVWRDPRDGHRA